jgi:hypothetical protein
VRSGLRRPTAPLGLDDAIELVVAGQDDRAFEVEGMAPLSDGMSTALPRRPVHSLRNL